MSAAAHTLLHQLCQQAAPLRSEEIGPGQAAISTNHTQVCDAPLHQVMSRLQTTFVCAEIFASCTADNSATLKHNRTNLNHCKHEMEKRLAH